MYSFLNHVINFAVYLQRVLIYKKKKGESEGKC